MTPRQVVENRVSALLQEAPPDTTTVTAFLGARFDAGLARVHYPVGHGGLGLSAEHQPFVDDVLRSAGAPDFDESQVIGTGMAAPVILSYGTVEQRQRYLRSIFSGENIWCQLFSEPGAGSDVAGLATAAVREGNDWVVNGQKVWTSKAHIARYGLLVTRTDPDAPKHRGLTYFILDMSSEGVDVRPLRQMTGDAEFNEVFLTDVRVPDSARLGEIDGGWAVVLATLMNERVALGLGSQSESARAMHDVLALWEARVDKNAVLRDRLMRLWIEAECLRLTAHRAAAQTIDGAPGPEGSVGKLATAEFNKRVYEFGLELLGAEGMLYSSYELRRPAKPLTDGDPQRAFLRSRANSIEGGTSEVLRNLLAERVLGLPGDVRVDRDVPWRAVPRS